MAIGLVGLLALWWFGRVDYLVVVALGGFVGMGELVARYKDDPLRAVRTLAAAIYVTINSAASAGALYVVRTLNWDFGQTTPAPKALIQVLVAGFGAMALFRSSLFKVRVGDSDVGVGPSSFLQVVLDAADRSVDRRRAHDRAVDIGQTMAEIPYGVAISALPLVGLALMQNVAQSDQQLLAVALNAIRNETGVDEHFKVVAIGLKLQNVVGDEVLKAATDLIRTILRTLTVDFVAAAALGASTAASTAASGRGGPQTPQSGGAEVTRPGPPVVPQPEPPGPPQPGPPEP